MSSVPPSRRSLLAVVLTIVVLLGGMPVSVADGASTHDPTATLEIDEELENATGTIEVIITLEDEPVSESLPTETLIDDLEEHALDTQEPVETYADETPGVTVLESFWVTNALLLEVDTEQVDLETFEQFGAVTAIHKNVDVPVPEPPAEPINETVMEHDPYQATAGIDLIDAPTVWKEHDVRGDGVRVAVLDTGVDAAHPDIDLYTEDPLDPTYPGGWASFDAHGEQIEGSVPHDLDGHGTHVSGTVAGGNTTGTSIGVAPEAELLHGQVLSSEGGTFAQLLGGIEWALEEDADIVNLSLGIDGTVGAFVKPMERLEESGILVIAAVGNDGHGTSSSPANSYDVSSVGAVSDSLEVANFSGGETIERDRWNTTGDTWPETYTVPTIAAPGVSVPSAVPGGYARLDGTSMATPHVTGAAALLLEIEDTNQETLRNAMYDTAWHPEGETHDDRYGQGVLNVSAAAHALETGDVAVAPPTGERVGDRDTDNESAEESTVPDALPTLPADEGAVSEATDWLSTPVGIVVALVAGVAVGIGVFLLRSQGR